MTTKNEEWRRWRCQRCGRNELLLDQEAPTCPECSLEMTVEKIVSIPVAENSANIPQSEQEAARSRATCRREIAQIVGLLVTDDDAASELLTTIRNITTLSTLGAIRDLMHLAVEGRKAKRRDAGTSAEERLVWVLVISTPDEAADVRVYATQEEADADAAEVALACWTQYLPDDPVPQMNWPELMDEIGERSGYHCSTWMDLTHHTI